MGLVLSTLLDYRNSISIIPHPTLTRNMDPKSFKVPGTETETTSAIYRHPQTPTEEEYQRVAKEYYYGKNCVQIMQERCRELGPRPGVAFRPLEKVERREVCDAEGKSRMFDYYHFQERQVLSYENLWRRITAFGAGLRELGISERSTVTIYEETRWEWIASIYGIWTHNMIATTVYANLGADALAYALAETDAAAIICGGATLKTLIPQLRTQNLHPIIIYFDNMPAEVNTEGFRVVPWVDVVAKGEVSNYEVKIPMDNDVEALVMYTSGTTGNPKGVLHTHGSIAAGIKCMGQRLSDIYQSDQENEVYCAFLPLAHILEFGIVNIFLQRGSLVGFSNPRTLTDDFAVPHGDFKEFKPTIIIGVPRIFDSIKRAVEAKLPPPNTLKRAIFEKAYTSRLNAIKAGYDTPFWNKLAFKDGIEVLGGKTFAMLSGGGPLSAETHEMIAVCFGGPLIIQGWGLTETVCCGAIQRLDYIETGDVGQPVIAGDLKLLDVEGYKHTDTPEPRGEILVRGPFLFKGYYKQEKLTREVIDADGWFHTGDVGSIGPRGTLRLIGRVKALAKNVLGEYIAMELLESIYSQNSLCLTGGVCILVHPSRAYICALVLTDSKRALDFAQANDINGTFEELLQNEIFHEKAAKSLAETAKNAGRKSFELVKFVRVLGDEWTPENGLVTPTAKLRRSKIDEHYADLIKKLFKLER